MWWGTFLFLLVTACTWGPPPAQYATGPRAQLHPDPSVPPSRPTVPLRRFTKGEALYIRNCADCHGWEGRGNGPANQLLETSPPSLRRAELFTRYSEPELIARILIGKELFVPLTPSADPKTDEEVSALLVHLRRIPTVVWEQAQYGQEVYDSLCLSCHGIYGRGDGSLSSALPALPRDLSTPPYQQYVTEEDLVHIISEGKGAMPGAAEVLSVDDIRAVVAFIRILSPGYERYDRLCAVCHGDDGHPSSFSPQDMFGYHFNLEGIPTFNAEYFRTHTDDQIRPWIRHMLKTNAAAMPHFAGALDSAEVRQILGYLRTLTSETQTTAPAGR